MTVFGKEMYIYYKHHDLQKFGLNFYKKSYNFHPLELVGRGSEIRPQVGGNFNPMYCAFTTWSTAGDQGLRRIIHRHNIATYRDRKKSAIKQLTFIKSFSRFTIS